MTLKQTIADDTGAFNPVTVSFLDKKTITGWDATLSMDEGVSVNINAVNLNEWDKISNLQKVVELSIVTDTDTTDWVKCVITSIESEVNHATSVMSIKCASTMNFLYKKPINTYTFSSAAGHSVQPHQILNEICQYFAAIPSGEYSFTSMGYGEPLDNITVSEESIIHALKQIAQAGGFELFVNKSGVLCNDEFKDVGSSVNYTLEDTEIITTKRVISEQEGFSAVRVRGRYLSGAATAAVEVYNNTHEVNINYTAAQLIIPIYVQNANTEELMAGEATTTTPGYSAQINSLNLANPGEMTVVVFGTFTPGLYNINITVNVKRIPRNEYIAHSNNKLTGPKSSIAESSLAVTNFNRISRVTELGPRYRSDKSPDEQEDNRVNLVLTDSALADKYGVRWLEIDNPYIPNDTVALLVAQRAFVEQQQIKSTWQLDIAYNKNLDLNQVISWLRQDTKESIKGVIRKINLAYNAADSSVKMSLVVEELNDSYN